MPWTVAYRVCTESQLDSYGLRIFILDPSALARPCRVMHAQASFHVQQANSF